MTTTKKSNIVVTERNLHIFKEVLEKTPYSGTNIRENTRKHNTNSLDERVHRETAIERHVVPDKFHKNKHIANTLNLAKDKEIKMTKNRRNPLKLVIFDGNQAPSLQEANKFDKQISRHNQFRKEFHIENGVVARKLDRYLNGDIHNKDTITKLKYRVEVSTLNKSDLMVDWEHDGGISEKRKRKFTVQHLKNSFNNSKDWNFLDEANYYDQHKDGKLNFFNHDRSIHNKHLGHLNGSTVKAERLDTTRRKWKLFDKAANLYEVIKKRKVMPKRGRLNMPNLNLDKEKTYSDITVKDVMEAVRKFRYDTTSFKTYRPMSILKNIVPSFINAHANKMFNINESNRSSAVKYTTITPSKIAGKSIAKFVNRKSFNLQQTLSNVFTNLSSGSILRYNVNRPKIKLPIGKEVAAKTYSDDYHYYNDKRLYREKKRIKSLANEINDFSRQPSKIAKYKKRLHPKLGDLNEFVQKITLPSTNFAEDIIQNSLDRSSKNGTLIADNYNRKSTIYDNIIANRCPNDTKLQARLMTKKRFMQDNALKMSKDPRPVQSTNYINLSPALTLKFTDHSKIPPVNKYLREETVTVTNIKDVLFNYLENLTNMKQELKVASVKNNMEISTIKTTQQNEFEGSTFMKSQESAIDKMLPTKLNMRRSGLVTTHKSTLSESPSKYTSLKSGSLTKTSKVVPDDKMGFDSTKASHIMRLRKSTENHEAYTTTTTTLKTVENPTFAERILAKILNLKTDAYDMSMLKEKLKEAELRLRKSLIKYLNVSESVKKDLAKSSSNDTRPALLETLKYPSVFDVYPNIGRWQPKLELGSGVPTIVTNVSNDLTNENMPPMRHWSAVIPPNEPVSYNEDDYLEETTTPTYTEIPDHIKFKKQERIQAEENKRNQFSYNGRPDDKFLRNPQILPYVARTYKPLQDMNTVNTTALAIRQEILRQKARKKFLEQIEGVRNKDLIKILFTSPYINQHLNVNPSLQKQRPGVFNSDMYSVLPLNVANYQKYKKEDRLPPEMNVFVSDSPRPRWVLPINNKNKFHEEMQSTDSVSSFYKLENDFLDITKSPETTVFPQTDVDDIVSDLADDLDNTENKLESGETSVHNTFELKIDDDVEPIYDKAMASVKHPFPTDRVKDIQNLPNTEGVLRNIVKDNNKKNTTTEKITFAQLNDELLRSTASLLDDIEDKDIPIIDEGPIEKIAYNTEKSKTESDELAHYIEYAEKEYEPAKTHIRTFKPNYVTVIPRKFTTLKTHSRWEEDIDEKNMKTSYSKPIQNTHIKYPDSVSTNEPTLIEHYNNVVLPTYLPSPPRRKYQYYTSKPQQSSNSASSPITVYATSPVSDDEVGTWLSKHLEDQETLVIDTHLRPSQTFWKSTIFATTARTTTEPLFDELLRPIEKPTNDIDTPSTESDDVARYIEGVESDYELTKTQLTTSKPKYSPILPRKFTTFKTHITWAEEIDKNKKKTSYSNPIKDTDVKYPDEVPTYRTAPIADTNNLYLPNYFTLPFQGKDQYYTSKPRIPITSAYWPIVTYATSPIRDDEVEPSLSNYLEDQETPIINKDLRPLQSFWKPTIFATTARSTTELIFDELFRPIENPTINIDKPSTESDDLTQYIAGVGRRYDSVKPDLRIFKPKYLPTQYSTFKTYAKWEEEIDERNKKTNYSNTIKGTGLKYPGSVPTNKTASIEYTNNVFPPTSLTSPFQEKDQYDITKPRISTFSASGPIVTYETLSIADDEAGPTQSTALEEQETPFADEEERPVQKFWEPIFATTARTTIEPIIAYPTPILQGNDEMDLEGMSPKPIYEMESEHTQKNNENQADSLYEKYRNNLLDNNVTTSTSAALASPDGSEVTQITLKNISFKLTDWREFTHTTTYLPNIRHTITPRGKEKEEDVFSNTLYDLENEELTTAKTNVSWSRPTLAFENTSKEPVDTTLVNQDNEYETAIPTFLHRTVSRQNLSRIIPIFKDIGITTTTQNYEYGYNERYKTNEILTNLSRNPILTTHHTIFKPYTYSVPAKDDFIHDRTDDHIFNATLSKENDEDRLEKPILRNQVTLKPFLSENKTGTDEKLLDHIKEDPKQHVLMTTPFPKRTVTSSKSVYESLTKSGVIESKRKKYDNSNYTRSTTTRPIGTPTLPRNKLKPTISGHILRSTVSQRVSRTTLTKHIERTATRTLWSYNNKSDDTDNEVIMFHKNDVIILNNNHTKVSTATTDPNENSLITMKTKDEDSQSPMIDIGLRPIEDKWKPLYVYGVDKTSKKDQNDSEKIKEYDEKFLNDKSTDEPDCKGDKCKSRKKYTTVIRPTKTYAAEYRNTTMNVEVLPKVETVHEEYKLPNYTEIIHNENTLQQTTLLEFVTLSAVTEDALNKLGNSNKIKPTERAEVFTVINKVPDQKKNTKKFQQTFLDNSSESSIENVSSPDVQFESNVSAVFSDKTADDKTDTDIIFEIFPDEIKQRPDSSPDKKSKPNLGEVPYNEIVIPRTQTTTLAFDDHYPTTTEFKYETTKFNQNFWTPKFFPKKKFTSTKPTIKPSRTPPLQEYYVSKKKLKGYPTNIDMKGRKTLTQLQHHLPFFPTLTDATKYWSEYVQRVDERIPTRTPTKYMYKPTLTSPLDFETIEHQSTSPTQSTGETPPYMSTSISHQSETPTQEINEHEIKSQYMPIWKPEKSQPLKHRYTQPVFTYPITSPQTTMYQWPKSIKPIDTDVQEKQIGKSPIAVLGNIATQKPFTPFTTSTYWSPLGEEISEMKKPKLVLPAIHNYVPILEQKRYKTPKPIFFPHSTSTTLQSTYRWIKPNKSDVDVLRKPKLKQYPYVPILIPKTESTETLFNPFTTTAQRPWIGSIKGTYKLGQNKEKVDSSVKYQYVPILGTDKYPHSSLTSESNHLTWGIHPVFEEKAISPFPVYSVGDGKGVIPTKPIYTRLEGARMLNKKQDWKSKLLSAQQNIPIPIYTYSFTPKHINPTKFQENSYKALEIPYAKHSPVPYFVLKKIIPTSTHHPVPSLIPYATKAPNVDVFTTPEHQDRMKIKYPVNPTYTDRQSGYHKKPFSIFIDLNELPHTHNTTHDNRYPDKGEYFDTNKHRDKNVYPYRYSEKYRYPAKGKYLSTNRYYPNNGTEYYDNERYLEKETYYDQGRYPNKERLSDQENYPDINRYPYKDKYPHKYKGSNKDFNYPYENKFYQDRYPKPPLISTVKSYDQYNKNNKESYLNKYTNEHTVSSRPGGKNSGYPDKDIHLQEDLDEDEYRESIPYSLNERYINKEKEPSEYQYPHKDKYDGKDRYPYGDGYQDGNIYSDRDRYTDEEKETSEDKYPDKDIYSNKESYPDKYPDKNNYYKYPPIVNVHSTYYTSEPTLPNNKDKYHHGEKSNSFDKYRQEERYYDQKYPHKYKYYNQDPYIPPTGKYTTHDIFAPKRIHIYKETSEYKHYFDTTSRNEFSTIRIPSAKDRIKYPDIETYPDDRYSDDIKYQDKSEFNQNLKTPGKSTVKSYDQFHKNTDSDEYTNEPIVSSKPTLGDQYPNKDVYIHKDRLHDKEDPEKNRFFQVQYSKPPIISTMKDHDKYPDNDKNPDKVIHSGKDRNLDKENNRDINSVPTYPAKYPYLPDITILTSTSTKPSAVRTTPVRVNYGYDLIPGGITKEDTSDNRPKVPSLTDLYTTNGFHKSSDTKPPIVHGPAEKNATSTQGSELDEMNYENRSTLSYQPELNKIMDLLKKTTLPITKAPYLTTKAKVEVPNFGNYNTQGPEDKKPELICGKDKSPASIVYEGAAKIETYPWLGVLVYPRGR